MSGRLLDSVAFFIVQLAPKRAIFFFSDHVGPATVGDNTHLRQTGCQTVLALVSQLAIGHVLALVFKSERERDGSEGAQRPVYESSDTPCTYHQRDRPPQKNKI
jgi:hypothetical protein